MQGYYSNVLALCSPCHSFSETETVFKLFFFICLNIFFSVAEQELVKLQQQYRIMEGDRKAYSEESQNLIRKQRAAIEALQKENEELMKENKLAGSQQNKTKV